MPWPPETLAALTALGVRLDEAALAKLDAFVGIIRRASERLNLVSAGDLERLYERHLFDSLVALPFLPEDARLVIDVGSGAGLPGIPLAIARPETRFLLVDRTRKKVSFVTSAAAELGLSNVDARWTDAREVTERADVVTVRAVAATDAALGLASPRVVPGGLVLLWQSADQRAREALPDGYVEDWREVPSRDATRRGIRIVTRTNR